MPNSPSIIALRDTRSKAPTPSTDKIVALGSRSVSVWRTCETHSQPARVLNAYWKGAVAFSADDAHCFAIVRATSLRRTSLTTIPLTPPSAFFKAVTLPNRRTCRTVGGTCAPGKEVRNLAQQRGIPVRLQQWLQVFASHA